MVDLVEALDLLRPTAIAMTSLLHRLSTVSTVPSWWRPTTIAAAELVASQTLGSDITHCLQSGNPSRHWSNPRRAPWPPGHIAIG